MQTFLPYPSFSRSAAALDRQRLGKQRVEALQILNVLQGTSTGWRHHPAVRMWVGHKEALALYGYTMCKEWIARGYRDTCQPKFLAVMGDPNAQPKRPAWFGDDHFHQSHQSNLLRKLPAHYAPQFPGVSADLPYVWPSRELQ